MSDDTGDDEAGDDGSSDDAAQTETTETEAAETGGTDDHPKSLRDHVAAVVTEGSNRARLLDADCGVVSEVPAADVFDAVSGADGSPVALVLDGELSQRVLDVAAQRGIDRIVAESEGEYVKRPASVRVVTAEQLLSA